MGSERWPDSLYDSVGSGGRKFAGRVGAVPFQNGKGQYFGVSGQRVVLTLGGRGSTLLAVG